MSGQHTTRFTLGGMIFEYDEDKNLANIRKHGISFRSAARVFFDYDRIEMFDEENSIDEDRFNTIGDASAEIDNPVGATVIGSLDQAFNISDAILFVVYTERMLTDVEGTTKDVTRLISARRATSFERGLYYGKYQ